MKKINFLHQLFFAAIVVLSLAGIARAATCNYGITKDGLASCCTTGNQFFQCLQGTEPSYMMSGANNTLICRSATDIFTNFATPVNNNNYTSFDCLSGNINSQCRSGFCSSGSTCIAKGVGGPDCPALSRTQLCPIGCGGCTNNKIFCAGGIEKSPTQDTDSCQAINDPCTSQGKSLINRCTGTCGFCASGYLTSLKSGACVTPLQFLTEFVLDGYKTYDFSVTSAVKWFSDLYVKSDVAETLNWNSATLPPILQSLITNNGNNSYTTCSYCGADQKCDCPGGSQICSEGGLCYTPGAIAGACTNSSDCDLSQGYYCGDAGICTNVSSSLMLAGFWKEGASNSISNTNIGNVGIGTTTPPAKFVIQGGQSNSAGISVKSGDVDLLLTEDPATNAGKVQVMRLGNAGTIGTTPYRLLLQPEGGDVGIGGNLSFSASNPTISTSSLYFVAPDGVYFNGGTVFTEAAIQARGGISNDANTYLTIGGGSWGDSYFSGKVGIGTMMPINKLDVEGGVAIGTTYSGTYGAPLNGLIVEGNVGIGTSLPSGKLTIRTPSDYDGQTLRLESKAEPTNYNLYTQNTVTAGVVRWGLSMTNAGVAYSNVLVFDRGNVGIGTTTPANKLDVEGGAAIGALYSGSFPASSNGLIVQGDVGIGTTLASNKLTVAGNADFTGNVGIGAAVPQAKLDVNGAAIIRGNINTAGDALELGGTRIGVGNAYVDFHADNNTQPDYSMRLIRWNGQNSTAELSQRGTGNLYIKTENAAAIVFQTNAADAFTIYADQTGFFPKNLAHGSDLRRKTDVNTLNDSLGKLEQLRGVSYKWKDDAKQGGITHYGLIAQEVQQVLPDLVVDDRTPEKMLAIDYDGLIPVLIEAVKEQQKTIEKLNERVTELERGN